VVCFVCGRCSAGEREEEIYKKKKKAKERKKRKGNLTQRGEKQTPEST
jgi:hypothetical protein